MSDRRIREEYVESAFRRHPEIKRLYDTLGSIDALYVDKDQTDGSARQGQSLFGVYFADRRGPYEAFLWVNEELVKSYVQWKEQGRDFETCRRVWADVVNNPKNPDGSNFKKVDCETLLRLTNEYIAATGR